MNIVSLDFALKKLTSHNYRLTVTHNLNFHEKLHRKKRKHKSVLTYA